MLITSFSFSDSLAYRETTVERAVEAKLFFHQEGLDSGRIPMVHEMVTHALLRTRMLIVRGC